MTDPTQLEFSFPPPLPSLPELWTPNDIFDNADQTIISNFEEDKRIEKKSCRVQIRLLGDYLSAFSNTQPHGGIIILGYENDGKISGCKSLSSDKLNEIEKVTTYCPDARIEIKRVSVKNTNGKDDFVILIRVFYRPDKLVENTRGEAFIRVGDEKRQLLEDHRPRA